MRPVFDAALAQLAPVLQSSEAVPFRFTPNMQHFVTPNGMEGLMTSGIMAIGRCLTEPEVRRGPLPRWKLTDQYYFIVVRS